MLGNIDVILASASPRRTELLTQAGIPHQIVVSDCEEKATTHVPEEYVMELAVVKAEDVFQKHYKDHSSKNFLIIGSDTVVAAEGKILGKPKSDEDAHEMISLLQDNTHQVYTGVTVITWIDGKKGVNTFCERSDVDVYPMSKEEIDALIERHAAEPHLRELQRTLARELTVIVHSKEDLEMAEEATQILFGKGTSEALHKFDEATLLSIFEGVPQANISKSAVEEGLPIIEFLTQTNVFPSKGEARKMLQGNGVAINKEKVADTKVIGKDDLLNDKYILVQKGKKNYYLIIAE